MEENTIVFARLKAVKSSPVKVVKVTRAIVGLKVVDALSVLKFCNLKLASVVRALVLSAIANAENNHNMDIDKLYVNRVDVGRAFALKRFSARGRGKSSRILKTFSNISVALSERQSKKPEKADGAKS